METHQVGANDGHQTSSFVPSPHWSLSTATSKWPRGNIDDDVNYVLHGRIEDLPKSSSKTVRIFLSSTFTDTYCERNLLIKMVYPKLKAICRSKYDLDFQVVDMRWGIRDEASVDHRASEMCMNEILNCQRVSVGPTFVRTGGSMTRQYGDGRSKALLSERYGSCPLPRIIPEKDMTSILHCIPTDSDHQLDLVKKWYKLDENAIPKQYVLQPLADSTKLDVFLQEFESKSPFTDSFRQACLGNLSDEQLGPFYDNPEIDHGITAIYRTQLEAQSAQVEGDDDDENSSINNVQQLHNKISPQEQERKETLLAEYNQNLKKGRSAWREDEPVLTAIIKKAVSAAVHSGLMDGNQSNKYFQSVTEEEVMKGLVAEPDSKSRCLVFLRDLENINTKHDKAWRFVDIDDDDGIVDSAIQERLTKLKEDTITKHLSEENIIRFKTKWSDDGGVNFADNAEYLEKFCDSFEANVMKLIDEGVKKKSDSNKDPLFSEVLSHSHQCAQKVEKFHGREDILDTVKSYIQSTSDQPLVLYGESGSGKSSIMAKAASQIPRWFGDNEDMVIILRFLGSSPDSFSVHNVLKSITKQILKLTETSGEFPHQVVPDDYQELKALFLDLISRIPNQRKLVILLDSLDQLSAEDNAHSLYWLPRRLSENVKLVVSTLPNTYGLLEKLRSDYFHFDQNHFISVASLDAESSGHILKLWLANASRTLADPQWTIISEILTDKNTPLYLKLVFDEMRKWKSYESPVFKCKNVKACIQRLYRITESKHGELIVSRALGYVAASENGLSYSEIEDLLSLDDDVLSDVFQFHIPPVRRLPSALWSSIRQDLSEYIVDREADGVNVMSWYHQQFRLEANKRYLPGTSVFGHHKGKNKPALPFYRTIAEYFSGKWSGNIEKPFTYTEKQRQKLGLQSNDSEAVRYVATQPNIFGSDEQSDTHKFRYNRRKVTELPNAAFVVYEFQDNTKDIAEHIALNVRFLSAWIATKPWKQISEFLNAVSIGSKYNEEEEEEDSNDNSERNAATKELIVQIATVLQSLMLSYTRLKVNPTCMGTEISGRLLQYNTSVPGITNWIRDTDLEERDVCAFIAPHLQLETSGSELTLVDNSNSGPVVDSDWSVLDNVTCVSASRKVVVNNLQTGDITVDSRPRSVPENDSFRLVTSAIEGTDSPVYLASLQKNPWVYVFDNDGEVANVLKFETMKGCTISGVRWVQCEGTLTAFVFDSGRSVVHIARHILSSEVRYEQLHADSNVLDVITQIKGKESAAKRRKPRRRESEDEVNTSVSESEQENGEVTNGDNNRSDNKNQPHKFLIMTQNGECQLYLSDGTQIDKKTLKWRDVAVHSFTYNEYKAMLVIGFTNGQYSTLQWDPSLPDLSHLNPLHLFDESYDIPAFYANPHYVKHHQIANNYKYFDHSVALACTESSLVTFAAKSLFDEYNKSADGDHKKAKGTNRNAENRLLQICRIDKRYNLAVYSSQLKFILAADRGNVDIFQIGDFNKMTNMTIDVEYFGKLDIHGADITNILPAAEDVDFLTASADSTMKFQSLQRIDITRRYLPSFDRSDDKIIQVISGDNTSLTLSQGSSMIYVWGLIHGRVKHILSTSQEESIRAFGAAEDLSNVVAVDTTGRVLCWNIQHIIEEKEKKDDNKRIRLELLPPSCTLQTALVKDPILHSNMSVLVLQNGSILIASPAMANILLVQPDKRKCTEVDKVKGHVKYIIRLSSQKVLLISETDSSVMEIVNDSLELLCTSAFNSVTKNVDNISHDLKYMKHSGDELVAISGNDVIILNKVDGIQICQMTVDLEIAEKRRIQVTEPNEITSSLLDNKFRNNTTNTDHSNVDNIPKFSQQNSNNIDLTFLQKLKPSGQSPRFCEVTSDGQYIVHVAGDADVYLTRISDGKLIAWYTLYDKIEYMTTSTNSWFVQMATSDRRLFVLLIADPDKREHDDRVMYVRSMNFNLPTNQSFSLMKEAVGLADDETLDFETIEAYWDYEAKKLKERLEDCQRLLRSGEQFQVEKPVNIVHEHIHCDKSVHSNDNCSLEKQTYTVTPCSLQ